MKRPKIPLKSLVRTRNVKMARFRAQTALKVKKNALAKAKI